MFWRNMLALVTLGFSKMVEESISKMDSNLLNEGLIKTCGDAWWDDGRFDHERMDLQYLHNIQYNMYYISFMLLGKSRPFIFISRRVILMLCGNQKTGVKQNIEGFSKGLFSKMIVFFFYQLG